MTLSHVFSGTHPQANAPTRQPLDKTPGDPSTEFYSYLNSSAQDTSGETNSAAPVSTVKTSKTGKSEKKTETNQNQDANNVVVPLQTESMPQPSPLVALLGLPTNQTIDVDETGKATPDDGKAVLPLTSAQAKTDATQPAPKDDRNRNANPVIASAALPINLVPQPVDMPNVKEDSRIGQVNAPSDTSANGASGNDSQLQAAGASAKDAAPASTPGNLAFALRLSEGDLKSKFEETLQSVSSTEPAASSVVGNTVNPITATVVQAAASSELKEQSHGHDNSFGQNLYEVPLTQSQKTADTPQAASEQPTHTTATDFEARQETAGSEPVRNVHMQVIGDNNNRVDVRMIDRGGELHVSVKSGDLSLTRGLQEHMPELTSRLEQGRFHAEVWMPKLSDVAKPEMSGTRDFSSDGNSGSNSSNGYSDQQRKGKQQHQPDWVDVLENSTGGSGRTN